MTDDELWSARVRRLEEEVSGLRRALRSRGLIEQAKGMLAERLGTDPEQAFTQLSKLSQKRNVAVAELAADIVSGHDKRSTKPSGFHRRLTRAAAGAAAAASLPDLAEILLRDGLCDAGVQTVAFAVGSPAGLRVVACSGADPGELADSQSMTYPIRAANGDAFFVIKWADPAGLTASQRAAVDTLAQTVDRVAQHLVLPAHAEWDQARWLHTVFTAVFGEAELLTPVRDESGAVVDFVVDVATTAGLAGSRLLDLEPHVARLGVFDEYVNAMESGSPFDRPAQYETVVHRGRPRRLLLRRRAVRLGDQLLVAKQHLDMAQRQNEQVAQMEVIGRLGFAEWDLATGEAFWTPGLHRLFGRDESAGPSSLDKLPNLVNPGDALVVQGLITELTVNKQPVDVHFRVEDRVLRLVAEPKVTPQGDVHLIQAVAREVTAERAAAEALRRTEVQLGEQRMRSAAERELTRQMRQIWYPAKALDVNTAGIRVRGRHWVSVDDPRFQADFVDATIAADGDLLIAVGDIVGSGLAAAATMTRLMYPARVMGHAGSPPAEILTALNMELHRGEGGDLAGLVLARYMPADRTLFWAQAGHLSPVLLRGGTARQLAAPDGVLLGLHAAGGFGQSMIQVEPGDLIFMFTDGIAFARRDAPDPLPPLLREFERLAGIGGADAVLDWAFEPSDGEACLLVLEG